MKIRNTKRHGGAYLIVMGTLVAITLVVSFVFSRLNQTTYESQLQNLRIQTEYISKLYADITIEALTARDDKILKSLNDNSKKEQKGIEYKDESGKKIATIDITVTLEEHEYFKENKKWATINIKTTIVDNRPNSMNNNNQVKYFTTNTIAYVLQEDSTIRIFNKVLK